MSADDILAANLWPWPDPLLKRDLSGNVMFVNAAFLQLYGGRVEDWRGRPVSGWPAPVPQGAQRFETRSGEPASESIFDWVEMVMADGTAMAIARNVTAIVAPPPLPPAEMPTAALQPATAPVAPPPVAPAMPAAPQPAPVMEARIETPVQAPDTAPEVKVDAEPEIKDGTDFEGMLENTADDYSYDTAPVENTAPGENNEPAALAPAPVIEQAAPVVSAPVAPTPPPADTAQSDVARMTPRRALPIEDSSAVLGSNWRDQVIAKAVGVDSIETAAPVQNEPVSAGETTADDGPAKPNEGLRILLAEDNAINALLTRTLLEAEGAIVDVVEDGALAVEAVKTTEYDMILMDMRMPNMDGLESTRKIRSYGYTRPIVALTANAFDDDRNSCFDSGMNDFMTKPVSAEELSEMVTTWVNKSAEAEMLAS